MKVVKKISKSAMLSGIDMFYQTWDKTLDAKYDEVYILWQVRDFGKDVYKAIRGLIKGDRGTKKEVK